MNGVNFLISNKRNKVFIFESRIKFFIAVTIMIAVFISPNNINLICLVILVVFMWILLGEIKSGIKTAIYYVTVLSINYLIGLLCNNSIIKVLENLSFFLLRIPIFFIMGSWFIKKIRIGKLIKDFQKLYIPKGIIISICVVLRFIPTIQSELKIIINTMHQRKVGLSFKNIITRPIEMIEYTIVPMLFRSLDIADELSSSAITRGLQLDIQRTSIFTSKLDIQNILVVLFNVTYIMCVFLYFGK